MTNVYQKSPEIILDVPEERVDKLLRTTDDLTKIKGIGPDTVEKLNTREIYSYRQLAEMTPEKLSEAPGIGIATARKFIEEAKNLLSEFQEQNSVNKQNQVIEKTTEILKKEKETEVDNIETFEVAEVIVEEELSQEKFQREEKPIETNQKQWFNDKFNYSRLTASHPPILERSSIEPKVEIEEIEIETEPEVEEEKEREEEGIGECQEEVLEELEDNATVEPFESEVSVVEEDVPREETIVIPTYSELPEVSEIPEIPENINIPEISKVPTSSSVPKRQEDPTSDIAESLKNLGYYPIPSTIEALNPFFQNIDYLGCKLVSVNDNSKLIVLVLIKLCDLEGTILIDEDKIDFKAYSKAQESELVHTARLYADDLLKAKDAMFENVVNGANFQDFFQKYFQIRFTAEKSAKNKKLYFVSGQTQYKVLIEPVLLTKIPAKCLEKSMLFPYQRKSNLHVIDKSNIAHLLRFLEKKYQLIESRTKKINSIEIYQNADKKFRTSLRWASLPFLGYSIALLVIYFSQLYFLLRLFNSIGFTAIGIYSFSISYFYFKFYKTKRKIKTEFETPYYLQNAQFNEIDLLCVKEEFTDEQMAQFGYECFGKDNDFKVLEQIEKNTIKESVVAKKQEIEVQHLYGLDSEPDNSSIKINPNHEIKYSSFFDD